MPPEKGAKKVVIVKKVVKGGGGHHGGSWKVAYADFVTAMMAFFMVMWILGMDDQTKQAIEGYFANPVGYKKGAGAGSSPIANGSAPTRVASTQLKLIMHQAETQQMQRVAGELRKALDGNAELKALQAKVEVVVTREGLRIELIESGAGEVFFPIGATQMKPAAVIALQTIAPALGALPNPVVLEGHTDAARYGNGVSYTNWELSSERANAARRVLQLSGLPAERVIEVRGYADRHLRDAERPLDPANRRISILLPYSQAPVEEMGPDGRVTPARATGGRAAEQVAEQPAAGAALDFSEDPRAR